MFVAVPAVAAGTAAVSWWWGRPTEEAATEGSKTEDEKSTADEKSAADDQPEVTFLTREAPDEEEAPADDERFDRVGAKPSTVPTLRNLPLLHLFAHDLFAGPTTCTRRCCPVPCAWLWRHHHRVPARGRLQRGMQYQGVSATGRTVAWRLTCRGQ